MNNKVEISGVVSNIQKAPFDRMSSFYMANVACERLFANNKTRIDNLNLMFKEAFLKDIKEGQTVHCVGVIKHFYDKDCAVKNTPKTMIYVLVDSLLPETTVTCNSVEVEGEIIRQPSLRETHNHKNLCGFTVASTIYDDNRSLVPVITWGDNALKSADCKIGDKVAIKGRLQERKYKKVIDGVEYEMRVHEVCADEFIITAQV